MRPLAGYYERAKLAQIAPLSSDADAPLVARLDEAFDLVGNGAVGCGHRSVLLVQSHAPAAGEHGFGESAVSGADHPHEFRDVVGLMNSGGDDDRLDGCWWQTRPARLLNRGDGYWALVAQVRGTPLERDTDASEHPHQGPEHEVSRGQRQSEQRDREQKHSSGVSGRVRGLSAAG